MRRRWTKLFVTIATMLGVAGVAFVVLPAPAPDARDVDWAAEGGGPRDSRRVYWVGHSLMNAVDSHVEGSTNLLERVGELAEARGHEYDFYDHTLYGSPLSLLWRGRPHSYQREEPMAETLAELLERGGSYDALVMTEAIPVQRSMKSEHTAHYAQRFYCAMLDANPDADVYLYETWTHYQASDPEADYAPPELWDWGPRLEDDRRHWARVADLAMTGQVPEPGLEGKLDALFGTVDGGCEPGGPIYLVPVARAMARLDRALEERTLAGFEGRDLSTADLFSNPYTEWPEGWPRDGAINRDEREDSLEALPLRHPGEELDDVHPSELGVWFTSVVHYATLYRRDPRGLPGPEGLPEETARALAGIAWDVVSTDPRAGVRAD